MNELKDITVFSDDPQFARLLSIELSRTGKSVGNNGESCILLVFDADSNGGALPEIPHIFSLFITFDPNTVQSCNANATLKRPVSFSELRNSVNAIFADYLNAKYGAEQDELLLIPDGKTVMCNGKKAVLTPNEYSLLSLLLEKRGTEVSRDEIKSRIGGGGNTPDVYICTLRKKLTFDRKCPILTLRGRGYFIK